MSGGPAGQAAGGACVNELDVVLADAPLGPTVKVHAFNHLLGECGLGFYGKPKLAGG